MFDTQMVITFWLCLGITFWLCLGHVAVVDLVTSTSPYYPVMKYGSGLRVVLLTIKHNFCNHGETQPPFESTSPRPVRTGVS